MKKWKQIITVIIIVGALSFVIFYVSAVINPLYCPQQTSIPLDTAGENIESSNEQDLSYQFTPGIAESCEKIITGLSKSFIN